MFNMMPNLCAIEWRAIYSVDIAYEFGVNSTVSNYSVFVLIASVDFEWELAARLDRLAQHTMVTNSTILDQLVLSLSEIPLYALL